MPFITDVAVVGADIACACGETQHAAELSYSRRWRRYDGVTPPGYIDISMRRYRRRV